MPKDADVEIPSPILSSPPTTTSTETVSGENSARRPTAQSRKQPEPGPPATCPAPLADQSAKRALQSDAVDTLFTPLATKKTLFRPRSFMFRFFCFVLFFC